MEYRGGSGMEHIRWIAVVITVVLLFALLNYIYFYFGGKNENFILIAMNLFIIGYLVGDSRKGGN